MKFGIIYFATPKDIRLTVVFHHTDTHIYLLSLALTLSIHNKQINFLDLVCSLSHRHSYIDFIFSSLFIDS
jgi:hypothetical protein